MNDTERELTSAAYGRVWDRARESEFTPAEYASPLARYVYDLRQAYVSTWLSGGSLGTGNRVVRHSVAVLLRIYTRCFDGQDKLSKRLIQDILSERSDKHEE